MYDNYEPKEVLYKMNIGNELAQIKYCHTIDDYEIFCKEHNLNLKQLITQPNKFCLIADYGLDSDVDIEIKIKSKRLINVYI